MLQAMVGFEQLKNIQLFALLNCLERLIVEILKQPRIFHNGLYITFVTKFMLKTEMSTLSFI